MQRKRYTPEQRQWAVEQMSPPLNRGIVELSRQTGITAVSLRTWRNAAIATGQITEGSAHDWSSASKFRAVLEAAGLSQAELSEYCRRKAILPEQLQQWHSACEQANDSGVPGAGEPVVNPSTLKRVQDLERELHRKDAALAEAAALLILSKKADAIWGTGGEE